MKRVAERTGEGFEVQWYNEDGNNGEVQQMDTIEELAQYLARVLWGAPRFKHNPTIYYRGEKFCFGEYTDFRKIDANKDEEIPFIPYSDTSCKGA